MMITLIVYTADFIYANIAANAILQQQSSSNIATKNSAVSHSLFGYIGSTLTTNNRHPEPTAPATPSLLAGERVMVVEQLQIVTIWLVKACLLTMYFKVTKDIHWQHLVIEISAVHTALGFVVMEFLYFGVWCRTFSNYLPSPGEIISESCRRHTGHFIFNAVLNTSSDIAILCVMLPLFAVRRCGCGTNWPYAAPSALAVW